MCDVAHSSENCPYLIFYQQSSILTFATLLNLIPYIVCLEVSQKLPMDGVDLFQCPIQDWKGELSKHQIPT